jgi:hypothetical protein
LQLPRLSPPRLVPTKSAPRNCRGYHPPPHTYQTTASQLAPTKPPTYQTSRLPNPRLPNPRLPNPRHTTRTYQTTRLPNPRLANLAPTKPVTTKPAPRKPRSYPLATTKPAPTYSHLPARNYQSRASLLADNSSQLPNPRLPTHNYQLASMNPMPFKSDIPIRATTSRLGSRDSALPNSNPETRRYQNQNLGPPLPKTRRYQN